MEKEQGKELRKDSIVGNIMNISRCCMMSRRQPSDEIRLWPTHQLLLSHICRNPGNRQDQIAEALYMDKTTVAHHLVELEKKGYVERRVSGEDARCRLVYPTAESEALYPKIHGAYREFESSILEGLTEEEIRTLDGLMEKLMRNAAAIRGGRG